MVTSRAASRVEELGPSSLARSRASFLHARRRGTLNWPSWKVGQDRHSTRPRGQRRPLAGLYCAPDRLIPRLDPEHQHPMRSAAQLASWRNRNDR